MISISVCLTVFNKILYQTLTAIIILPPLFVQEPLVVFYTNNI